MKTRRSRRPTASEIRKRNQDRLGMFLIALSLSGLGGMFFGAYQIDKARGISVCESLARSGFGNESQCAR
jgi:hypothetical protein